MNEQHSGNYLQPILGTSGKNKVFTVYQNQESDQYHVYYGLELYDVVPNDKEDIRFKLMMAHLHIVGVTLTALHNAFGTDTRTIKKWSRALKSGDADKLQKALIGLGSNRKLTAPIEQFVRMRFESIYSEDRYRYSIKIRQEIKEVFNEDISAETLRELFKELKEQNKGDVPSNDKHEEAADEDDECGGDSGDSSAQLKGAEVKAPSASDHGKGIDESGGKGGSVSLNRNGVAFYYGQRLCLHLGLLFFSEPLNSL